MNITDFKERKAVSDRRRPKVAPYYGGHFLIYVGCLLICLVLVWLFLKVGRIYSSYQTITDNLATLEAGPGELDLTTVRANLRRTALEVETLSEEMRPFLPLTPYLGWLPVYGGDLRALPHLLALGRDLGQTGLLLDDTLAPLFEADLDVKRMGTLPYLTNRLVEKRADIEQSEILLRQHQEHLNGVEVASLSPAVAPRVAQLKQYLPEVVDGLHLLKEMPLLLGAEVPKTYLILTQNSDELRPTGGYINAAGHVIFDQGEIVEFVMQDSYAVDQLSEAYPYPPGPIYKYMAADYWVVRDASWSPDFPTAARTAIELYELGQAVSADGVVALDQQALPFLLAALGPLGVEGERVTSDNVIKLMREQWAPDPDQNLDVEWWLQRKSFMLSLAEIMRQKFERDFGSINLPVLVKSLQQALAEKHLMIYIDDPLWGEVLIERNWAGALQPVHGDYLMVVDANLGFNKASALVERRLAYEVTLAEDGGAQSRVNLFYRHPAPQQEEDCSQDPRYEPSYEANMERCYWNYARLVVPAGSELISGPQMIVEGRYLLRGEPTTGEIETTSIGSDKTSWGQLFLLPPNNEIAFEYVYTLPAGTAHRIEGRRVYRLYLQKQPGTLDQATEVTISLPEAARFLKSEPQPLSQQGPVVTYLVNTKTDVEITIEYTIP